MSYVIIALLVLTALSYWGGRRRALKLVEGRVRDLHSLPGYYGFYVALWCGIPAALLFAVWTALEPVVLENIVIWSLPPDLRDLPPARLDLLIADVKNIAGGLFTNKATDSTLQRAADHYSMLRTTSFAGLAVAALSLAVIGMSRSWSKVSPAMRARHSVERIVQVCLVICSTIAIFTTLGIVLSLCFEAFRFFKAVPVTEFLFGLDWSPQTAIREDQVGSSGSFGGVPLFAGTGLISLVAMMVAAPVGLFSAIYMSEYAAPKFRAYVKPALEFLAGIPTVVYGFFAALTVGPFLRDSGSLFGIEVSPESALAAGVVMGVMIIPLISSLSDDVISAVPNALREGSYGMGATQSETIRQVVLPAALPGIVGAMLLAVSRAVGETMIVVMAAGLVANLTANPFAAATTVTAQIVTLLVGDQEFDSPKTLAAFALGLVLFFITLALNVVALVTVRRYREKYD